MAKTIFIGGLFVIMLLTITLAGCRNDKEKKALAEDAAQAKADVVRLKAETVQLKSEISYLNEKLAAANLARDNMQIQLSHVIEDNNAVATDADDLQKENGKLRKLLAEQLKKNNDLGMQIETLKTAIHEIQAKIVPHTLETEESVPLTIEETNISN
jgi:chromosome segregation ATPase